MYVFVLMLGLAAAAAGGVAVGFGLSIMEFSLGNTLLIAGTTSLVGGLLMIAVAGAIRELRRIVEALAHRPAPRLLRPGEPVDPYAPGAFRPPAAAPRAPAMPPAPVPAAPETEAADRPQREPTPETTTAAADRPSESVEPAPLSPSAQSHTAGEPPAVADAPETVPLSPDEPRAQVPDRPEESPQPAPDTHQAAEYDAEHDAEEKPEPSAQHRERTRSSPFDAIWPARGRPATRRDADEAAPGSEEGTPSAPDAATPVAASEESEPQPEPPHPVSILKSGVVDGMAYTLYSDGSIEAELPSGTIRFASIAELREHLEKTE